MTPAPQLTFEFEAGLPALPVLAEAPSSVHAAPTWSYCDVYCRRPTVRYMLTLWPGQDREWTDPEVHSMCAACASKTTARGNRLTAI